MVPVTPTLQVRKLRQIDATELALVELGFEPGTQVQSPGAQALCSPAPQEAGGRQGQGLRDQSQPIHHAGLGWEEALVALRGVLEGQGHGAGAT